jgi:hypothetical protein
MPILIPQLSLTHGQALWAIGEGIAPSPKVKAQARYLRALGVPFKLEQEGPGRGNRVRYSFYRLLELAIAFYLLNYGHKPRDVAETIAKSRDYLGPIYGRALSEQPERAITPVWVKSRGKIIPILGKELFLRLHDRMGEQPGKFEVLGPKEAADLQEMFLLSERYPGERARRLVPLTRLALQLVAWIEEVPEIRPGPQ